MKISRAARAVMPVPLILAALQVAPARLALADTVTVRPDKDNTLFEDNPDNSNGKGANLYSGRTRFAGLRRALISFDVAGAVPPGSTVTSVMLSMNVSRVGPFGPQSVTLHRLDKVWGEGDSNAGEPGGDGVPAEPGDATWIHNIYDTQTWTNPGGDFTAVVSASAPISDPGPVTWGSNAQMVADVQSWHDSPGQNYGWILVGSEGLAGRASRFDSRQSTFPQRPRLTITYMLPSTGSGSVPDGSSVPGPELTLTRMSGGDLHLAWGASCRASDTDYEIYQGTFASFSSYTPLLCSTGGATSATFAPAPGSRFYLVVPTNGSLEGSYGKNSDGQERPPGSGACHPQAIGACF